MGISYAYSLRLGAVVPFIPQQDYILVLPIERKQSDILWTTKEKYSRGKVIAVGPGKWLKRKNGKESGHFQKLTVKPGDYIAYGDLDWIFPKYTENGIEYRICQEADVCFIFPAPLQESDAIALPLFRADEREPVSLSSVENSTL